MTASDPRVQLAREVLDWYDRGSPGSGTWTASSAINVVSHLANAARSLLAVVDEDQAAAAQLAAIRAVLAAFDWEHDDRQYALEKIERIVDGAQ